ncbi:MAG: hypothetical protein JRH15_17685 [Deltaproteobacteria bacterium]|nr:hypothetical protein [Deltaproteobacteria bacterium]
MNNLDVQDMSEILIVGLAALQCCETDELRTRVVNMLPVVFKADQCGFMLANSPSESLDLGHAIVFGSPNHEFWTSRYFHQFREKDPISHRLRSLKPSVSTLDQLLSFEELLQTDYYKEFLRPQAIYYMMFIELRTQGRLIGHIGLHRSKHKGNFSQEELAKAEQLVPYLAAALQNTLHLKKIAQQEFITGCVSELLPFEGVIILDEAFKPIYQNKNTDRIVGDFFRRCPKNSDLPSSIPMAVRRYCQNLKKTSGAKQDSRPQRKELCLVNQDGKELKVQIIRKKSDDIGLYYLVCLKSETSAPPNSVISINSPLKRYGVTRREVDVIDLVYQGFKHSEIAEKLFISKYTVNSHIASIYEKLGVHNRTRLLHLIVEMNMNAA